MSSDYTADWMRVENTVNDRMMDDSLLHTLEEKTKVRRRTKLLNKKLKRYWNLSNYKRFEVITKLVSKECPSDDDTDDDLGLTHEDYKLIYNNKPKSELRIVLRSFVKAPQKKRPQKPTMKKSASTKSKIRKKAPSHRSRKKSAVKNQKTLVQTTLMSYKLRSDKVTTVNQSNSQVESQAISNDPTSEAPSTSLSTTNKPQIPLGRDTTNQYDLPQDLNVRRQLFRETSTEPLISGYTQNESINTSEINSNSESELPDPIEKSMVEYSCTKTSIDELQCDVTKALNGTVIIESKAQDSHDQVPKKCNSSASDPDHNNASSLELHCTKLTETSNSNLLENNLETEDEIIPPEENLSHQIDNDKCTECSSQDSGNNSLSDADPSIDDDETTSAINNNENDHHQYSEITNTVQSKYQSNVLETEVQHEKFVANEKSSEKRAFNDQTNNVLEVSKECNKLELDLPSGIPEDNCTNKLKIRTIERFDKGCRIFNRCKLQEHEQCTSICTPNHKIANDSCNTMDLDETSKNEQQSNSSQLHERNSFCLYDINQSNDSMSDEDMLFVECMENESGMEVDGLSNRNKYSRECVSPENGLKDSNQSFSPINSADYEDKNSLKAQLLQEIDKRLRESIHLKNDKMSQSLSHEMNRFVEGDNIMGLSKKKRQDDNQVINNCSSIERNPLPECESFRNSDAPKTTSQGLIVSTNMVESGETPKFTYTKRRISSCNVDNSSENSKRPQKQPCLRQSINKESEPISHKHRSSEAILAGHSQSENNDNSITTNEKCSKASPYKSKRIPRPKDLQQFLNIEALVPETNKSHFRLKDIKDDDEIWIMEVPKTIHPRDLIDQSILLGGNTELEVGNDSYVISSLPSKKIRNISYVFPTSKHKNQYEFVNIESKGRIKFHQKISTMCETELISSKSEAVPFPKNIKIRHPLFGAADQNVV
ncbi:uncharacterized protein LOC105692757 [Athalia rosae]|uniref:uncharacterized protein LOC105692757 n=1 Tax=Athalia rosae TaxID=37344 RepID=UPI002033D1AC|nr:uncharacterized protein LOC105692757 [Athalia rosae]